MRAVGNKFFKPTAFPQSTAFFEKAERKARNPFIRDAPLSDAPGDCGHFRKRPDGETSMWRDSPKGNGVSSVLHAGDDQQWLRDAADGGRV